MFTDASGNRRVNAHAAGEPSLRIRPCVECCAHGRLARLDFQAAGVSQRDELARTLEIVMDSVNSGDVGVAVVEPVAPYRAPMQQLIRRAWPGIDEARPSRCRRNIVCVVYRCPNAGRGCHRVAFQVKRCNAGNVRRGH